MKAIIPAAGYATRLYPLTKDKPKALLEVKNKTILDHIVDKIEELGVVDKILVVTNEKFFESFLEWSRQATTDIQIEVLNDGTTSNEDRLGQVGDLMFAVDAEKVGEDFVMISGDNLFNFSLKPCYDFFKEKNEIVNALFDVQDIGQAKKLGVAAVNEKKEVVSFVEKPEQPPSTLVSLGIIFFPKASIALLKQYLAEKNDPDKIGYFFQWLLKKHMYYGFPYKEKWFDVGSFEALDAARGEFIPRLRNK